MGVRGEEARWSRAVLALLLLLFAVLVPACSDGSGRSGGSDGSVAATDPDEEPTRGGSITYGLALGVDGLNPISNQWNSASLNIGKAIYDPIVVLSPDGVAMPYLVESIRGIILSGLRYMPVWLAAWTEGGFAEPPPGFEPVLDALEKKDHAAALAHLKRVWADQEELLARYLERMEAAPPEPPARKKR